ncbi:MAG: CHAD domain-containing protein [Azovibrio sp.]|uniref:CHAD domain-containing protein n=1 Tax=Azovibrio sp. TaxID=1872673 RepID=UPI003C75C223
MFHYELSPTEFRRLRQHPALPSAVGQCQERQLDYFDTPEAALSGRGLLLARVRCGWEWRMELQSSRPDAGLGWQAGLLAAGYCGPSGFDFDFVSDKELRLWLQKQTAQLQRLGSEVIREEWLRVDTAAGAAGLRIERVEQQSGTGRQSLVRLSFLPLENGDEAAFLLCRALLAAFVMQPAMLSPAARIQQAGTPLKSYRAKPSLPAGQDGRRAFLHIVRNCISHLCLNLPGLAVSDDPEFVHQARVAIRRLRSALKLFAPWLPQGFVTEFSARWRDMANGLGDCRNLDVFLAETLPLMERELGAEDWLARLKARAGRERQRARRVARGMLASPEARLLVLDFEWALEHLTFPDAMPPLQKLARRRLVSRARQVTRLGESVRDLDPQARHELRIAFKKLRYALEFFVGLFGEKRSQRYLAGLVDLQEVLGHLNDLATAQTLMHRLLPPATARLPEAWLAGRVGALVDTLPTAVGHFLAAEPPWE